MPEVDDHYVGAEILLSRRDMMAKGHVVAQSCDVSGKNMERAQTNPLLDFRMYQVEFTGGKVTELPANVIAESMYTQCGADGSEYLLLDVLVNYHKDNRALFLTDQQITVWGRSVTCKTTSGWQIYCQ